MKNERKILVGNPEEKTLLVGKPRHRWKGNIKKCIL
jgi:hypothetical protein